MSIEGAGIATIKISTIAPPLGGAALAWWLTELFGANITLVSVLAAFFGVLFFYATNWGKDHLTDNALIVIIVFTCSFFMALWFANATYDLLYFWQFKVPKSVVIIFAGVYGFLLQTALKRLQVLLSTVKLKFSWFSSGESDKPFGSDVRGTSPIEHSDEKPFGSKPRSSRYDDINK